jgi:hypothetical protein
VHPNIPVFLSFIAGYTGTRIAFHREPWSSNAI